MDIHGTATVVGNLTNNASANDTATFGLERVPEGWNVEVRVGQNATTNLTLAASAAQDFELVISNALTPGDYNFTLNVTSTLGFAEARQLNVTVAAAEPSPTTSGRTDLHHPDERVERDRRCARRRLGSDPRTRRGHDEPGRARVGRRPVAPAPVNAPHRVPNRGVFVEIGPPRGFLLRKRPKRAKICPKRP